MRAVVVFAVLMVAGCGTDQRPKSSGSGPNTKAVAGAVNADPKGSLEKIYRAWRFYEDRIGFPPGRSEEDQARFDKYLKQHGDPKEIRKGISFGYPVNTRELRDRREPIAWQEFSRDGKYYVLLGSGRIDLLDEDEMMAAYGKSVGKRLEKWRRDEEAQRKLKQAEAARLAQEIKENQAKTLKEELHKADLLQANNDWVRVRIVSGPHAKQFQASEEDWVERRALAIAAARKKGIITVKERFGFYEYVGKLPLPTESEMIAALRSGSPLPVEPGAATQLTTTAEKKDKPAAKISANARPSKAVSPAKEGKDEALARKRGKYLHFKGHSYVELANTKGLVNLNGSFTVEMWVRFCSAGT